MVDSTEDITLVGYWNGKVKDWTLSKTRQADSDILVSLELDPAEAVNHNAVARKLDATVKKLSRELRSYVRDLKKIN